jgi:hypothetical protein
MKIVEVTADIYATADLAIYRLYVDDNLMTERTVRWDWRKQYVEERVIIQVPAGTTHSIRVEGPSVVMKNITVDGRPSTSTFINT